MNHTDFLQLSNLGAEHVAAQIHAAADDLAKLNEQLEMDAALRAIGVKPIADSYVPQRFVGERVVLKHDRSVIWTIKAISKTLQGCLLECRGVQCVADNADWMLAELVNDPMHSDQSRKQGVRNSWAGD